MSRLKHRICKYCGEPVILNPSAEERARKSGKTPQYYLNLFQSHAKCVVEARSKAAYAAIPRRTH